MTQYLPPNLLALFAPRDPVPFLPPLAKLPHEKVHRQPYSGIAVYVHLFEDPKDAPPPTRAETKEERMERKRREKIEKRAQEIEEELKFWDAHTDTNVQGDAFKTLFVARINYDTSESKLRREFEVYGPIRRITMIYNKVSGKPRGYAFIEYEHERDMHSAYKHADGKKIDGKRVLVDVERARTVKGWRPRRLGGGLGGTRRGGSDVNIKHSGRDDMRHSEEGGTRERGDRGERERRERSHERVRERDGERERPEKGNTRERDSAREREREVPRERDAARDRGGGSGGAGGAGGGERDRDRERRRRSRSGAREGREERSKDRDRKRRSRSRDRKREERAEGDGGAEEGHAGDLPHEGADNKENLADAGVVKAESVGEEAGGRERDRERERGDKERDRERERGDKGRDRERERDRERKRGHKDKERDRERERDRGDRGDRGDRERRRDRDRGDREHRRERDRDRAKDVKEENGQAAVSGAPEAYPAEQNDESMQSEPANEASQDGYQQVDQFMTENY